MTVMMNSNNMLDISTPNLALELRSPLMGQLRLNDDVIRSIYVYFYNF